MMIPGVVIAVVLGVVVAAHLGCRLTSGNGTLPPTTDLLLIGASS